MGSSFAWTDDCSGVPGVTRTDRAAVAARHLNRDGVVNLRRDLSATGLHPPADAAS